MRLFDRLLKNPLIGVRGTQNTLAWVVAGSLAYYLYVKPDQQREQEMARDLGRRLAEDKKRKSNGS